MKKNVCKGRYCYFLNCRKIISIITLVFLLFTHSLSIYSQTIFQQLKGDTLFFKFEDTPLREVFDAIEENTDYSFAYSHKNSSELNKKYSFMVKGNISEVLQKTSEITSINTTISGKQILVKLPPPKSETPTLKVEKNISGKVTDGDGNTLPGVTVKIIGLSQGTVTDVNGKYLLQVKEGQELEFSFVGMETQKKQVGENSEINIILGIDKNLLEEIVIVGYGIQKKSSLTASVVSVDVEEINKITTHDPAIALQGRAPGVQVLTQGGIAGSEAKIIIRGTSTFGNTEPLYVIDGAFSSSGLKSLNPEDIQSIEVLKDAAAAAIYGSRAANGVVIVTTKKGKKGDLRVDISSSVGMQTPSKLLDYANAEQWRTFANQLATNDGQAQAPENITPNYSKGVNEDWQNLYVNSNAPIFQTNASISGGGENITYSTSLGYFDQQGIIAYSDYEKYNFRTNLGFKKGKFEITENLGIYHSNYRPGLTQSSTDLIPIGIPLPTVPVKNSNGEYVSSGGDFYTPGSSDDPPGNRIASVNNTDRNTGNVNITGNIDLSYEIVEGLKYRFSFSESYNSGRSFTHSRAYDSYQIDNPTANDGRSAPSFSESLSTRFDYTIDNTLSYNKEFDKHEVDVLLGVSRFSENYRRTGVKYTYGSSLDNQLTVGSGDGTVSGAEYKSLLASVFGRFNYAYDSKYLLSVSVRRDKSSKFGPDNRVGVFPAFSAGWNIHNEAFFPKDIAINTLKIRGSYGELGANFINPYQYISTAYGPIPAIFGENQSWGGTRTYGNVAYLADPSLTWETSKSSDFGVEMGFLDNALSITADYFVKTNIDLLASVPVAPSVGQDLVYGSTNSPVVNSASVENKGFEFLVDYNGNVNEFNYNVSFNLGTIKNKVLELGDGVTPITGWLYSPKFDDRPTITKKDLPIGTFWGYETNGIDSEGNFIFVNQDDNEEINVDDKVALGDPFPDFTYGLNLSADYKDFDFSLFLQGQQGGEIFSAIKFPNYFRYSSNVVVDALDAWTSTNTSTDIPVATSDNIAGSNALPSDFYVEDASYLRFKNIQIGYTLSSNILGKAKINNIRLHLGVQNLFTISSYSGYDPEVSSNSLFDRGVDYRAYPNARTYSFGLNISL